MRDGRGVGPKKDHIYLHLDHLDPAMLHERLPYSRNRHEFSPASRWHDGSLRSPCCTTAHYCMGGIPGKLYGEAIRPSGGDPDATVPGLMAAGEAACVSVHGANNSAATRFSISSCSVVRQPCVAPKN